VKGKDVFLNEGEALAYLKANYQLKNATYVHAGLHSQCADLISNLLAVHA
jgi:hypothetical protein